jgi:hypothetical protein
MSTRIHADCHALRVAPALHHAEVKVSVPDMLRLIVRSDACAPECAEVIVSFPS